MLSLLTFSPLKTALREPRKALSRRHSLALQASNQTADKSTSVSFLGRKDETYAGRELSVDRRAAAAAAVLLFSCGYD